MLSSDLAISAASPRVWPIAALAFGRAHAGRLLPEYHDEQSGTFGSLRLVPDEKVVVLDLVTTKTSRVERPEP